MTQPAPQPGWYPELSGTLGQRYWDGQQWTHYAPTPPPQPSIVINNIAAPTPVVVTTGPNHALHLILTLLTCGLWLPVWLIVAIAGRQVQVAGLPTRSNTGRIIGGLFGGLFLLGLAVTHSQAFLGLVALAGLGYLGYRAYERAVDRRAEQVKVAARADAQHRAFMSGDPSGIYGQYPPAPPRDQS